MSDNRPPRYEEHDPIYGDRVIYRASSLGMCDKVFVALAMGYEPKAHPQWFQDILDEGTANEQVIREMWEADSGIKVRDVGKMLEIEVLDGVWIRGSIDGWYPDATNHDHPTIWDAKKIRTSGWARYLRSGVEFQNNYPMQFSAYMHMWEDMYNIAPDMEMTGGHYQQDDKTGEWSIVEVQSHTYDTPMVNLRAIKQLIVKRERLIAQTQAIGDVACTTKSYPCPFYYLHDEDDAQEPPTRPSDDIVTALVRQWDEIDQQSQPMAKIAADLKKLQDRKKVLQDGIKAWMEASGQESGDVSQVEIDGNKVALKYLVSPRKGFVVEPGEQTRVTIRVMERDGQETGAKPIRGAAPPKPLAVHTTEPTAPPTTNTKLAPRTNKGTK